MVRKVRVPTSECTRGEAEVVRMVAARKVRVPSSILLPHVSNSEKSAGIFNLSLKI